MEHFRSLTAKDRQLNTAWDKMARTNIDKFERSGESADTNPKHMLDLTGENVDWRAKCQRTR